jgi:hypothetical protein
MEPPSGFGRTLSTAVRLAVGFVLLTAAGLKLYGLNVSPFAQYGWLAAPRIQVVVVEWEIVLGVWLVSGRFPRGAWLASLVTFVAFTGVSLYLAVIGRATCGCFGTVEVSPWYAAALDLAVTGALLVCGPFVFRSPASSIPGVTAGGARVAVSSVIVAWAVVGLASLLLSSWYGSMAGAMAALQGRSLTHPEVVDLGEGRSGERLEAVIVVHNWSDSEVRVVGGTTDCTCTTTLALPATVPPQESLCIPIVFRVPPTESGLLTRRIELWTDHEDQRVLPLQVHCRVR